MNVIGYLRAWFTNHSEGIDPMHHKTTLGTSNSKKCNGSQVKRLHITNGDSAADIIGQTSISGEVLPWRDPMHHGPFPVGDDQHEISRVRARYLAGPDLDLAQVEAGFRERDDKLLSAASFDSVVLWFEHDLLDQLQILQILDCLGTMNLGETSVEMICIDEFPGIEPFRGIGQLNTDQMASLFDKRTVVTEAAIELAKAGWAAFCSDDPQALTGFLDQDFTALPFLRRALLRHLEEYPSTINGLSRTEQQIMQMVADGIHNPGDLFGQNMEFEQALFIGDWRTYSTIEALCDAGLLTCEPGPFWHPPRSREELKTFVAQRINLTSQGERVLVGEVTADGPGTNDFWLGGVHFSPDQPIWMWDKTKACLTRQNP